jgi:hypothetical protein
MNIPPEAIDSAFDKFRHLDITTADIEGILEAAAPYMCAEAKAWDRGNRAALGRPNPYRSAQ